MPSMSDPDVYDLGKKGGVNMGRWVSAISLLILASFLAGCGETVHGMVKDTRRIGTGIKTVFIRD